MCTINRTNVCTSLTFMLGLIVGFGARHFDINFTPAMNPYHVIVVATVMFHLTQIIPRLLVKKSE